MFIGQTINFAGAYEIQGTMFCDGRLLKKCEYPNLFDVIGYTYGGSGSEFALPDARSRVSIGAGQGDNLSNYALGDKGGLEQVALSINQMPKHSHLLNVNSNNGDSNDPANRMPANTGAFDNEYASGAPNAQMSDAVITEEGGNAPHENRQPYWVCTKLIVVEGIYPLKKSC